MFDDAPTETKKLVPINLLSVTELLALRAEIDAALPATRLADMNLEQELVIQLMTVKELQAAVLDSRDESNKKAQVCNSVASTIQQLVKMQVDLYTAERLKEIESKLIQTLNRLPREATEEFFMWYASVTPSSDKSARKDSSK